MILEFMTAAAATGLRPSGEWYTAPERWAKLDKSCAD
jgi:hypothetical protein